MSSCNNICETLDDRMKNEQHIYDSWKFGYERNIALMNNATNAKDSTFYANHADVAKAAMAESQEIIATIKTKQKAHNCGCR